MEIYLTIGFFVGLIMIGVYWGLPLSVTGPKSGGRVVWILISSPFVWPVSLAFYAVRLATKNKQ